MSAAAVDEEVLKGIRRELSLLRKKLEQTPRVDVALLTKKMAAKRLRVGKRELAELIKSGVVLTVPFGDEDRVPVSEIARLSRVDPPKVLPSGVARRAAALSKLSEPVPGARESVLRVRNAKRTR